MIIVIISPDLYIIGRCNIYECELPTTGTPPPMKAFYHYPPLKADEIDRQVSDYLKYDLIEECVADTPFLSNCVLVKKKSGAFRLAADYRGCNTILQTFSQSQGYHAW